MGKKCCLPYSSCNSCCNPCVPVVNVSRVVLPVSNTSLPAGQTILLYGAASTFQFNDGTMNVGTGTWTAPFTSYYNVSALLGGVPSAAPVAGETVTL